MNTCDQAAKLAWTMVSFKAASFADVLITRHALLPNDREGGKIVWRAQKASALEGSFEVQTKKTMWDQAFNMIKWMFII